MNYEVSNTGLIRLATTKKIRRTQSARGYKNFAYYSFEMKKHRSIGVHRAVALAFISNPYGLAEVNHKNGDKQDNRVENLEWISSKDNKLHAIKEGLHNYRLDNGRCVLSQEQVTEIRNKYQPRRYTAQTLADEYGCSKPTIDRVLSKLVHKRTYA